MSALGLASLGVLCENKALGQATLGVICVDGVIVQPEPQLKPAGHRKHLFRPVQGVDTHEVKIEGLCRVGQELPIVKPASVTPLPPGFYRVEGESSVGVVLPKTRVSTPEVVLRSDSLVRYKKPKGEAYSRYVSAIYTCSVGKSKPAAVCVTPDISVRGITYYSYWTPETVQNPTDEMLSLL